MQWFTSLFWKKTRDPEPDIGNAVRDLKRHFDEQLQKLNGLSEEIARRERTFREEFEHGIARELRAYMAERLREERIFREEFSHALKHELLNDIQVTAQRRPSPVPYDRNGMIFMHSVDGQRILLDLAEPFMAMHMVEHGAWEPHVREVMRRLLAPGSIFVDVGANIGLHTLFGALLVGARGQVMAVEPHPRLLKLLKQNIEVNGLTDRVTLHERAVSDRDGEDVDFEYFPEHPGMSGFRLDPDRISRFHGAAETLRVKTVTVDAMLLSSAPPSLIKVDVEGFELLVVRGALSTLTRFPDVAFLLEWESALTRAVLGDNALRELTTIFAERGYIPMTCRATGRPQVIDLSQLASIESDDVLFIRKESRLYNAAIQG